MYNLIEGSFKGCELRHVARSSNEEADRLANICSTKGNLAPLEKNQAYTTKVGTDVKMGWKM